MLRSPMTVINLKIFESLLIVISHYLNAFFFSFSCPLKVNMYSMTLYGLLHVFLEVIFCWWTFTQIQFNDSYYQTFHNCLVSVVPGYFQTNENSWFPYMLWILSITWIRAQLSQSGAQVLLQFGALYLSLYVKKRGEAYYEIHMCFCLKKYCYKKKKKKRIKEKQGS